MGFTIDEIIDLTEKWLITGDLNPDMLGENFIFNSPYWENYNKSEFIKTFYLSTDYKTKALANIIKFDPVIKFRSLDGNFFSIILRYFTKNGSDIYEAILGKVEAGKLIELRSIYDLEATKKAHGLK